MSIPLYTIFLFHSIQYSIPLYTIFHSALYNIPFHSIQYSIPLYTIFHSTLYNIPFRSIQYSIPLYTIFSLCLLCPVVVRGRLLPHHLHLLGTRLLRDLPCHGQLGIPRLPPLQLDVLEDECAQTDEHARKGREEPRQHAQPVPPRQVVPSTGGAIQSGSLHISANYQSLITNIQERWKQQIAG